MTDQPIFAAMPPELADFLHKSEAERIELARQSNAILQANGDLVRSALAFFAPQPPAPEDIARHEAAVLRDKRDWFAGAAMAGAYPDGFPAYPDHKRAAREAYAFADAMMSERGKSKGVAK